jgi:phenylacetate-CoA ligase
MYSRIIKLIIFVGDLFLGYSIFKNRKYWKEIFNTSEDRIDSLQISNLEKVLSETASNVPYYKKLNLNLSSDPILNLKTFPILTKDILTQNEDQLISEKFQKKNLQASYSSGSTGKQSRIYMSKSEKSSNWGILLNIWEIQGYNLGDSIIQTGMSPNRGALKSVKDFIFKTNYVNAFSHSYTDLKAALMKSAKNKDNVIIGYASSLNVLAEIVLQEELNISVKNVISFGDKLFNHYKTNIEKAFNIRVKESYGSNEGLMVCFEDDIEYMYIISPHVYVEIVDEEGNEVPDGELGHVLLTRLDCFSMPIIRYKLGDLAIKLPKEKYPTKRKYNLPLLQKIVGRETDVIYLKNQERLTVHSFTGIFEYIPEIKQFKVVQEHTEGITIEYIKNVSFTEQALVKAESDLRDKIKDGTFQIEFKEVSYIAPSKSGKPQIVESSVKR